MSDNKLVNRIPFEDIQSLEAWKLPSMSGRATKSAKKNKSEQGVETIEEIRPEDLQPVTAEQLQQVSLAAEAEGREKGYQEGLQQGFAEGESKGLKLGEQKAFAETKKLLEEKAHIFQLMADALLDPVNMQDNALESTIIEMAVHFTRHLIDRELTQDPSSLFKIVERAVNSLPTGAKNIRIHLHADDAELAHEAFEGTSREWTFHVDSSLSRGGCRVETEQSLIDYSVEHRLETMLEKVNYQGEVDPQELDSVTDYSPSSEAQEDTVMDAAEDESPAVSDEGLDLEE